MASNWTVCGVCDSLKIAKPSVVYCSECDEGLCDECDKHHAVSKASRAHCTIPVDEYNKLPTDILEIRHNCLKHNEKYLIYCRKHDCPCCHKCVIESHNDCKDIIAIVDIIKDVKSSNALSDIEHILVEVAENLEKITKDRKDNLTSLIEQRKRIEIEIQQTRIKINCHLDQVQEDLMKELNTKMERERKKIEDLLTTLEKKREEIEEYKRTITNIKQHASDLQTFLAIKQIENNVSNEERFLEILTTSESLKQILLSLKDKGVFQKISNFKFIGQIEVEMRPIEVVMTRMKGKQAQLEVSALKYPRGITVDNDGNVYVASSGTNKVIVISSDGKRFMEMLSVKDGLYNPSVLDYDKSTNQLLVANESKTAFLFQVESKN
ncbi:unnamed protein product [Mytilus coruscus]|uniref:B box-type domain-containing protein n=1 Tax=Mytilus coruscus TaxID=42192 RepID=A0A6J8CK96_MYTCO|nr:unnamed protein product [Mytilus coruscus]